MTDLETYLDSKDHSKWKEVIPYLITFHVNYKEDVFRAKELEIATKLNLELVCVDSGKISYKNKIKATFQESKYSYLKHLSDSNMLHFYHQKCELKLVNNVISSKEVYTRKSILPLSFAYTLFQSLDCASTTITLIFFNFSSFTRYIN